MTPEVSVLSETAAESARLGLQVRETLRVFGGLRVPMERVKGVEPSTSTLGRSHSTTELHPRRGQGLAVSPEPVKGHAPHLKRPFFR